MAIDNLRYSTEATSLTVPMVAKLFGRIGFGSEETMLDCEEMVVSMFAPGSYGLFAFDDGHQLVGLIRVLSDDYSVSWIAELAVDPAWQDKGLGEEIIDWADARFGHAAIYSCGLPKQRELLEKKGIKSRAHRGVELCSRAPNGMLIAADSAA